MGLEALRSALVATLPMLAASTGPDELDEISRDAKKRVMLFWLTTVAPVLQQFWLDKGGIEAAMVIEDTTIPAYGTTYKGVLAALGDHEAQMWGYGLYVKGTGRSPSWHGIKGISFRKKWIEKLTAF